MKKIFPLCCLFLIWTCLALADEVVYTSDGKTVILRDDGTFRIMDPSYQGGRYKPYGSDGYKKQNRDIAFEKSTLSKTAGKNRSKDLPKPKKKGFFDKLISDVEDEERGGPPKGAIKR